MPKGVHNNHRALSQHGRWKGGVRIDRGYVFIREPKHPRAVSNGYVKLAVLVLEAKLGRALLPDEEPHHIDENKLNDAPDNLEALTHVEHARRHAIERAARTRVRETRSCAI